MKHLIRLGSKNVLVKPYTTEIELSILEDIWYCESGDTQDVTDNFENSDEYYKSIAVDFLEHLTDYNIASLSKIEQVLLIWKIRELTIGDEVSVVYKCPECKRVQQDVIHVGDICQFSYSSDKFISTDDFQNLNVNPEEYEDMDFDAFIDLKNNLEKHYNIYNDKIITTCKNCSFKCINNLLTYKNCLKFLSEDSFQSLTEWLNVLVYYGHHTRSDILKMTPIQRMLEIKYFKKIKASENAPSTNQKQGLLL